MCASGHFGMFPINNDPNWRKFEYIMPHLNSNCILCTQYFAFVLTTAKVDMGFERVGILSSNT